LHLELGLPSETFDERIHIVVAADREMCAETFDE
jgi:hypothetical protein